MAQLRGKTVIITGASSGIGKALAYRFAMEGANLVLAAKQYALMCEIAQDIEQQHQVKAIAVATDVSKEEYCKHLIQEALRVFSGIDILINNAGISMRALVEEMELSVMKEVMDINFWGTVYCTKYALPEILKSKGSIVAISSVAGYKGLPGRSAYSASKFAIHGFLESLRMENQHTGIHVMLACPGFTATNIRKSARAKDGSIQGESPMDESKMMQPDEVARHIINALHKRKNNIVLTFQGKLTLFTNKFFPSFVDKKIYQYFSKEQNSPLK